MVKSITITYQEADEGLLMALFNRLKIAIVSDKKIDSDLEIEVVRKRLHDKYVVTGQWSQMTDEAREDAAHAETIIYRREKGEDYLSKTESDAFLKDIEAELQAAIEETYHVENLVDHKVVMQRYEKWLKE